MALNDIDAAVESFKKALDLEPNDGESWLLQLSHFIAWDITPPFSLFSFELEVGIIDWLLVYILVGKFISISNEA